MRSNLLHSYYQVGGEAMYEKSIAIAAGLNARLQGPSVTFDQLYVDEREVSGLVRVAQPHSVNAFHYRAVEDLKLSLFYVTGSIGAVGHAQKRLESGRGQRSMPKAHSGGNPIAWGKEGMLEYVVREFPIDQLLFNGLRYDFVRPTQSQRPVGSLRVVLDREAEQNKIFFEAQRFCVSALKAISGQISTETADSVQIGTIDASRATREHIETVVADESLELEKVPLAATIGGLVLKYKQLSNQDLTTYLKP